VLPSRKRRRPRGAVDTSVVVAGIGAFKTVKHEAKNPSATFLRGWLEDNTFTWLITEEILSEYKTVLGRLGVRRHFVGAFVNYLREEAVAVEVRRAASISPDPGDDPFCNCAEQGNADFLVTLNPRDFPQERLLAKVISPGEPISTTASRRSRSLQAIRPKIRP
jgi:predicted nucleic acid-binding protein